MNSSNLGLPITGHKEEWKSDETRYSRSRSIFGLGDRGNKYQKYAISNKLCQTRFSLPPSLSSRSPSGCQARPYTFT